MTRWIRLPTLTSAWLRASLAPALVFIATATNPNYLADFWHHLARGRAIVTEERLLDTDRFTYTVPGQAFQDGNWLTQVLYYHLYTCGGLPLIQLLNAAVLAATMGLLVWHCRRTSGSLGLAAALGVFTFFGLWQVLTIRPQTFSLLLFVLLYALLDLAERSRWLLLAPPAVLALWANLHGAFPLGFLLIGCFLVARAWEGWWTQGRAGLRDRQLLALATCLLASVLATWINPYGWQIYHYVTTTSGAAAGRRIDEWVPPSLHLLLGKVWIASLLLVVVAFALPRRRPTVRDVCLVLCFLPLSCSSARLVVWWLLVTAPLVAVSLAANWPSSRVREAPEQPSFLATACFGVLVLLVALSLPGLAAYNPLLAPARRAAPQTQNDLETVAAFLPARATPGRIFCRFEWGEYLSWALTPRYTVFMDGRIEIYPDEIWAHYTALTCGQADWAALLDRYQVDYLLLDAPYHVATGLLPQVERSPTWQRLFQVGEAVLFVRRSDGIVARAEEAQTPSSTD